MAGSRLPPQLLKALGLAAIAVSQEACLGPCLDVAKAQTAETGDSGQDPEATTDDAATADQKDGSRASVMSALPADVQQRLQAKSRGSQ